MFGFKLFSIATLCLGALTVTHASPLVRQKFDIETRAADNSKTVLDYVTKLQSTVNATIPKISKFTI
jgi:hypothetical protein